MKPISPRLLGAFTISLAAAWTLLAVYAAFPAAPYSPLRLPHPDAVEFWVPQGWAFFTRNPREQRVFFYTRTAGGWTSPSRTPHGRPRNAFGFNRASRAEGVEMALLMDALKGAHWGKCVGAPFACLDAVPVRTHLKNATAHAVFCGTVGMVLQDPVPWAWQDLAGRFNMPSLVLKTEVAC
jgi:antimicrobial peptide system SdpA family protein